MSGWEVRARRAEATLAKVREQAEVGRDKTLGKWAYRSRLMVIEQILDASADSDAPDPNDPEWEGPRETATPVADLDPSEPRTDDAELAQALYRTLYDAGVSFESNNLIPRLTATVRTVLGAARGVDSHLEFSKVTRVTVVLSDGVVFERYNAYAGGVELHLQDNGRTLKLFPVTRSGQLTDHTDGGGQ